MTDRRRLLQQQAMMSSANNNVGAGVATTPAVVWPLTVTGSGLGSGVITSAPAGISCTSTAGTESSTCVSNFVDTTSVTLTATPGGTDTFTAWTGDGTSPGPANERVIVMGAAKTVDAAFAVGSQHTLTVTSSGTGTGTIVSTPAGINATVTAGTIGGTAAALFDDSTNVSLAWTGTSSDTNTWSGDGDEAEPNIVAMGTADKTVNAATLIKTYTLTVTSSGYGTGTIQSTPAGIDAVTVTVGVIGSGNVASFARNTSPSLAFTPAANHALLSWTGDGTGTAPSARVVAMGTANKATSAVAGDDIDVLVAGIGTPLVLYDYRSGKTGGATISAWAPTRYTGVGNLTATSDMLPADDGTTINFDGVNDNLASALTSALNLSTLTDFTVLLVAAINGVGDSCSLDIRNASNSRTFIIGPTSAATNVQLYTVDSAGATTANSGVAIGTTVRALAFGSRISVRAKQIRVHSGSVVAGTVPTGTFASEDFQLILGAASTTGSTRGTPKYRAVIIVPTYLNLATGQAGWDAFVAWAQAIHGAA